MASGGGVSSSAGALGLGTMPIRLLLEHDHSFDPGEVALLVGAFESTLAGPGLTNREDRVTLIVAPEDHPACEGRRARSRPVAGRGDQVPVRVGTYLISSATGSRG